MRTVVSHEQNEHCMSLQVRMSESECGNWRVMLIKYKWTWGRKGNSPYSNSIVKHPPCIHSSIYHMYCTIKHLYARMLMTTACTPPSFQRQLAVIGVIANLNVHWYWSYIPSYLVLILSLLFLAFICFLQLSLPLFSLYIVLLLMQCCSWGHHVTDIPPLRAVSTPRLPISYHKALATCLSLFHIHRTSTPWRSLGI